MLAALLTGLSAYALSTSQPDQYRASARLIVRADSLDFGRLQASRQVLASFAQRIDSVETAQPVIDSLRLDKSVGEVLGQVTVSPSENDLVMQIDVTDRDPERAALIANGFADEFVSQIEEANAVQLREDQIEVSIIAPAGPGGLYAPQPSIAGAAGALLGLLLGGLIVLAVELLDDTIKTRDDIERYVGRDLLVLGQLPPGQPDLAPAVPTPNRLGLPALQQGVRRA